MTKKLYKVALLAALGLGGITAAQAQDALLGFNDAGGTGNDYVIDLGAGSQFTPTATLNLSSLFNASTFNTAFGATPDISLAAGLAGQVGGATLIQSYAGGTPAQNLPSGTPTPSQLSVSFAAASGIALGYYSSASAPTTGSAWSANIAQSTSLGGLNGGTSLGNNTGNPMGSFSSGDLTLALYESTKGGTLRAPTASPWTEVGTLDVNLNSDSITYTGVAAVPEPTTYGLLAGAGLLIVSLRNKFSRKNA